MFQSTIEASKNWSSLLTRVGFGTLALIAGAWLFRLPSPLDTSLMTASEFTLGFVAQAVVWLLASMLLGAVVVMLGAFGGDRQFSDVSRTRRAHRVGQTGNTLLAELLRDANLKYEIAAGFFGLLMFASVLGLAEWITRSNEIAHDNGIDAIQLPFWKLAVFGGLGGLSAYLIRRSATSSIVAIDQVLSEVLAMNGDET
ncbi:MAG: hypothetical protein R3D97_06775 [Paracoccaceae bacterium]